MTLREDFNKPLGEVENVYLRRSVSIILCIPMAFSCAIGGAICGFWISLIEWFEECW